MSIIPSAQCLANTEALEEGVELVEVEAELVDWRVRWAAIPTTTTVATAVPTPPAGEVSMALEVVVEGEVAVEPRPMSNHPHRRIRASW